MFVGKTTWTVQSFSDLNVSFAGFYFYYIWLLYTCHVDYVIARNTCFDLPKKSLNSSNRGTSCKSHVWRLEIKKNTMLGLKHLSPVALTIQKSMTVPTLFLGIINLTVSDLKTALIDINFSLKNTIHLLT